MLTGSSALKGLATCCLGLLLGSLGTMSHFLTLRYPGGLLQAYLEMPWWLGG